MAAIAVKLIKRTRTNSYDCSSLHLF